MKHFTKFEFRNPVVRCFQVILRCCKSQIGVRLLKHLCFTRYDVFSLSIYLSILYLNASDSYLPCLSIIILHVLRKNFSRLSYIIYCNAQENFFNWFFSRSLVFQYFLRPNNVCLSAYLLFELI